jgi:hypothetical protein
MTIVLALRKGPRARSGLAKALRDAGNRSVRPGGDDRDVVFALGALGRKGYVISSRGDTRGRCRFHLDAEPTGDPVAALHAAASTNEVADRLGESA